VVKNQPLQHERKAHSTRVPRIGIDCRLAGVHNAGIGRYISSYVPKAIALLQDRARVVLFCSTQQQAQLLCPTQLRQVETVIAPIKHYSLAEQTQFLLRLQQQQLDLLHVPHFNVPYFYQGKFVVTIHDLLWHKQRGLQVTTLNPAVYWLKYFFYTHIVAHAVIKAKKIFVPSQTIAGELHTTFPVTRNKTLVTYEGVAASLLETTRAATARKSNTLLYVGSLYPHKNVEILFQLLLRRPELQLEIVTARSAFVARVKQQVAENKLEAQVSFLLSIKDDELAAHYKQASAVVQPSLSEGFGLTGLEALLQNTPLIASDIPIFHEIYKTHAVFFKPTSVNALEVAWEEIKNAKQSTKLPRSFSQLYDWDVLAKQTTDAYFAAIKN